MTVDSRPRPDLRRSPLADRAAEFAATASAPAALTEIPFLPVVDVRVDPTGAGAARIADRLGAPLPTTPGTALDVPARDGHPALGVLWVGPDEWLVVADPPASPAEPAAPVDDGRDALAGTLRAALGDAPGSVVDVSAQRTTLELRGRRARDVLATGCHLDLHPRVFGPGRVVGTLLARAQVVLRQTDDAPTYRILVRASFADHVADWLLDAGREYREGPAG